MTPNAYSGMGFLVDQSGKPYRGIRMMRKLIVAIRLTNEALPLSIQSTSIIVATTVAAAFESSFFILILYFVMFFIFYDKWRFERGSINQPSLTGWMNDDKVDPHSPCCIPPISRLEAVAVASAA